MGVLVFLFLILIVTIVSILRFPPDMMGEEESFKAKVKDLWGIVKICQTASFGDPRLELKPANRSVIMNLHFLDVETVSMELPLTLKKQQKARADYLELFTNHDLKFFQFQDKLTVHLDRKDENLGELIAHLYKDVFEASDSDTVKFTAETLKSDMRTLRHFNNPDYKFYDDYTFDAPSSRHKGKPVLRVQTARILGAVYFLFYPPLIILSYKVWGLTGMCSAALIFFGFFAFYNPTYKQTSIAESVVRGSILYCILLSATLATQNVYFLQSIPSVIGVSTAIISAALLLGISSPKSKTDIIQKREKPREFKFVKTLVVIGGVGLFLVSEWARRNFGLEDWVWFFGLVRIELMLAMAVVFTPAYVLFLHSERTADSK